MPNRVIPYVALRSIRTGDKFWTSHDGNHDVTKGGNGETWYEIIGFANTPEEAQRLLWPTQEAKTSDMTNHLHTMFADMEEKGVPLSRQGKEMMFNIMLDAEK